MKFKKNLFAAGTIISTFSLTLVAASCTNGNSDQSQQKEKTKTQLLSLESLLVQLKTAKGDQNEVYVKVNADLTKFKEEYNKLEENANSTVNQYNNLSSKITVSINSVNAEISKK